ncbi:MAG: oxidoreductase [Bacteroidetes bacterium]|jgi:photosystem II stability/assembly factor-like uncharacterized protein|nr:oxidoreductase [Bacteroidota bacterium]
MRIAFLFTVLLGMCGSIHSQNIRPVETDYFQQPPHLSIRALQACSEHTVWFAANNGVYGFTRDGGKTWHTDSLTVDGKAPEFRSLAALNDSTVMLLSIDSPAYLFRTEDYGKTWQLVYTDGRSKIFFDALFFKDTLQGIAVSDPADACFRIITTPDGGKTWQQSPCTALPPAYEGEACFAASNSNLWWQGSHIRLATGGHHSRLFVSDDNGISFTALPAPIISGEELTGIFSIDFANAQTGYIGGGNYMKNDSSIVTLFKTTDGGRHWTPMPLPGYAFVSSVKIISANRIAVTGMQGTYVINSKGKPVEWSDDAGRKLSFYTLSKAPGSPYLWMAGSKGRIARVKINWQE